MDGTAIKAMMAEIAPVIRDFVADAQVPLFERIATLEKEKGEQAVQLKMLGETIDLLLKPDLTGVQKMIDDAIAELPTPEPAKEVDMEQVAALVNEAVAALPPPEKGDPGEDGHSVEIEQIIPAIVAEVERAVAAIPVPKDGKDAAGIVEALKDSGELVLTLQDGRLVRTGVRDGKDGEPGRDGFNLENYDEWFEDDGRTLVRRFELGEDYKEFRHQTVLPRYRQIFKEGERYTQGDIVTFGGSSWFCNKDTTEKPVQGSEDWSIMTKRGRDGKDAAK